MTKRIINLLVILIFLFCADKVITAQNKDSLFIYKTNNESGIVDFKLFLKENPANINLLNYSPITNISIFANYQDGDKGIYQNGLKNTEYGIIVNSLKYMKGNNTVWGNVVYRNGDTDKSTMNESSNYDIVYPYVISDTIISNNLKYEEYAFSGGYNHILDNFNLAMFVSYKAREEYRAIDPRPDNTSSDLKFSLGANLNINEKYKTGLALHIRKYKQNDVLEFHSILGSPAVYLMNGLGTYNHLFSGEYHDILFDGLEYGATLNFLSNANGFNAQASYKRFNIDRDLSELVYIASSKIKQNKASFNISYDKVKGQNTLALKLSGLYNNRNGEELKYKYYSSNIYKFLSSSQNYKNNILTASISGLLEHKINNIDRWNINTYASYINSEETYNSLAREISYSNIIEGIRANYLTKRGDYLLKSSASLRLTQNINNTFSLNGLSEYPTFYKIEKFNFEYLTSEEPEFSLSLGLSKHISENVLIDANAIGSYSSIRHSLMLNIGITF